MGLLLNVLSLYIANAILGRVRIIRYINNSNSNLNIVIFFKFVLNSSGAAIKILFIFSFIKEV